MEKKNNRDINKKILKFFSGAFILLVAIIIASYLFEDPKTPKVKKEKVTREYTTPYISSSNFEAVAVEIYLKNNLTDTSGFEIIKCGAVFELSNGLFMQSVTYKAKNYYGTLIPITQTFLMQGVGTETKVIAADEHNNVIKALENNNVTIGRGYRETQYK